MQSDKIRQASPALRKPVSSDGSAVYELVKRCPPLDPNSLYCNLLQCSHFADTCVVAGVGDATVGFTSAYLLPGQPHVLFIWQIAVDAVARGQKLAARMLMNLLQRAECIHVTHIQTTITDQNQSSWRVFQRLAAALNANMSTEVLFDRDKHFNGGHDSEVLVTIGPIDREAIAAQSL